MDTTQEKIGQSVRALAAAFGDQQTDLAKVLAVSQVSVSRKLRGALRWSLDDIQALAAHYNVTVDQVLAGPRAWLGRIDEPDRGDTRQYHPDALSALAA